MMSRNGVPRKTMSAYARKLLENKPKESCSRKAIGVVVYICPCYNQGAKCEDFEHGQANPIASRIGFFCTRFDYERVYKECTPVAIV